MHFLPILAFIMLLCGFVNAAQAEEAAKPVAEETPVTKLDAATKVMTEGLDKNKNLQFVAIETSYRTIRAVEDVQMSVSRAITSCSKENKDMSKAYNDTYSDWKESLRPTLKDGRTKLDKMILLQGFAQPSEVRAYLKKFDAAVVYRNQGVKSVPITSREDCDKLVANMAETKVNLKKLLIDTLALNRDLQVEASE